MELGDTYVGDKVELVRCSDPHTRLTPGTIGTVTYIDSMGTVFVDWEGGSSLGLIAHAGDEWRVIKSA